MEGNVRQLQGTTIKGNLLQVIMKRGEINTNGRIHIRIEGSGRTERTQLAASRARNRLKSLLKSSETDREVTRTGVRSRAPLQVVREAMKGGEVDDTGTKEDKTDPTIPEIVHIVESKRVTLQDKNGTVITLKKDYSIRRKRINPEKLSSNI
jgi:hypothetical protein